MSAPNPSETNPHSTAITSSCSTTDHTLSTAATTTLPPPLEAGAAASDVLSIDDMYIVWCGYGLICFVFLWILICIAWYRYHQVINDVIMSETGSSEG